MSRRLTERDLRHDADPVRFGDAMLRCEGYTPACSEKGVCEYGGRCFSGSAHLVAARMIEALLPGPHTAGTHFAYLQRVARMLRDGEVHL